MTFAALGLGILSIVSCGEDYKEVRYTQPITVAQSAIDSLFSPTWHTFVLEGNDTVTLLVNKFKTIGGSEERYLQIIDCLGDQYSIHLYDGYNQVTRIDNRNDKVVWYNEGISPEGYIRQRNTTEDESDVEDLIPSVYELLYLIRSQGQVTPFVKDDGEIVYEIVCL